MLLQAFEARYSLWCLKAAQNKEFWTHTASQSIAAKRKVLLQLQPPIAVSD
jgi:hypothetical protein